MADRIDNWFALVKFLVVPCVVLNLICLVIPLIGLHQIYASYLSLMYIWFNRVCIGIEYRCHGDRWLQQMGWRIQWTIRPQWQLLRENGALCFNCYAINNLSIQTQLPFVVHPGEKYSRGNLNFLVSRRLNWWHIGFYFNILNSFIRLSVSQFSAVMVVSDHAILVLNNLSLQTANLR